MERQKPEITAELIEYLDGVFADVACDPRVVPPEQHYGSALVVRHLKALRKQQQDGELDDVYV